MAYFEIAVSEEQVKIITAALHQAELELAGATDDHASEIRILHSMFKDLKDDESNYCIQTQPKNIGERVHITHGFCF